MRSGPSVPHRARCSPRTSPHRPPLGRPGDGLVAGVEHDGSRVDPGVMSTPEAAPAAPDPHRVPSGASGALPLHLGLPTTPRRSGHEAPPGTPPWLEPPPRPSATGLRWDNRGARRRRSSTTFGLTGRIVISTLIAGFLLWIAATNPLMTPLALGVIVWALRDVWASVPGIAPEPPVRPTRATGQSGVPE